MKRDSPEPTPASVGDELRKLLRDDPPGYDLCGAVTTSGKVYPFGNDTKVLSTLFELVARPYIYLLAGRRGLQVRETERQNVYPDFTLMHDADDTSKIAIDVKTTYRRQDGKFGFTLGGYTSFLRKPTKNIEYPFDQYSEHWILGFVYDRVPAPAARETHSYDLSDIAKVPVPIANVEWFVQEKWRIAGHSAGSGNTKNIGSIYASLEGFVDGRGVFGSEEDFLKYWRAFGS